MPFHVGHSIETSVKTNHYLDWDSSSRIMFTSLCVLKENFRDICSMQTYLIIENELRENLSWGEAEDQKMKIFTRSTVQINHLY